MSKRLAIDGGRPVRERMLPYGRQSIDASDIAAVVEALGSDWLTTGPGVGEFEQAFAVNVGASQAVAVSSGTAALHAVAHALDIGPGDEVVVAALTFAASANCIVYQGATPVFADVDPDTLLIDPKDVERKITARTRAIIAVDYAGQPCDYDVLRRIADDHGLVLVADACHSLGGSYKGRPVGTLADLSVFSLHPVKALTSGEGGVVTTANVKLAETMRRFRSHGITSDHFQRQERGSWSYDMVELGYNYRLSDLQCALALSQLKRLPRFLARRREIALYYDRALGNLPGFRPLQARADARHAYHLYVVRIDQQRLRADRAQIFAALRAEGIGANVHYMPVHLHSFYRQRFGTGPGLCPAAEAAYESILSLPLFPDMSDADVENVVEALDKITDVYAVESRTAALAGAR